MSASFDLCRSIVPAQFNFSANQKCCQFLIREITFFVLWAQVLQEVRMRFVMFQGNVDVNNRL